MNRPEIFQTSRSKISVSSMNVNHGGGTTLLLHPINVEFTVLEQALKHLIYIKGGGVGCVDEIAIKIQIYSNILKTN